MLKNKIARGITFVFLIGLLFSPVAANPTTNNCASAGSGTCSG